MGKSDFTLRLFLLACSLCEPGEPLLGTGTQAEKKKKKMVAKGFWLIQRILLAFVCRNNVKENQTSIRN